MRKTLKYIIVLTSLYMGALFVLSQIYIGEHSALQLIINNPIEPYTHGYSLERFREAEEISDVDILFIGSSHCYQSFDPAVFERWGVSSFNLGSNSQAPLNTFHLLTEYWNELDPKLVIFEIYPSVLELDGLEGTFELVSNKNLSLEMLHMTFDVRSPLAFNAFLGRWMDQFINPLNSAVQKIMPGQEYRSGGYVFSKIAHMSDDFGDKGDIVVPDRQLLFVERIFEFVQERGADIMLVTAPLPQQRVDQITNFKSVTSALSKFTSDRGVQYIDFNESMNLDATEDFRDYHHLNGNGAKRFSYAISDSLADIQESLERFEIAPEYVSQILKGRGLSELNKGRLDQALSDLKRSVDLNSNDVETRKSYGIALLSSKRLNAAVAQFDTALTLAPGELNIIYNRAIAYSELGQTEKALEDFRAYLKEYPQAPQAHYNLAQTYEKIGDKTSAIRSYRSFIKYATDAMAQNVWLVEQKILDLQK